MFCLSHRIKEFFHTLVSKSKTEGDRDEREILQKCRVSFALHSALVSSPCLKWIWMLISRLLCYPTWCSEPTSQTQGFSRAATTKLWNQNTFKWSIKLFHGQIIMKFRILSLLEGIDTTVTEKGLQRNLLNYLPRLHCTYFSIQQWRIFWVVDITLGCETKWWPSMASYHV